MNRTRTALIGIACSLAVLVGCSPAPTPAAPAAPAPAAGWQYEMLDLVNAHRLNAGLPPIGLCGPLNLAAQNHSQDQADHRVMSHTGSDGSTLSNRVARAGYAGWTRIAENVAAGYTSVVAVMDAWMNSAGHRANILSNISALGVGQARGADGRIYWTQDFGRDGSC